MSLKLRLKSFMERGRLGPVASFAASPLTLSGRLYGMALAKRRSLYRSGALKAEVPPIPVISVGNITLGGTGKTPLVELAATLLMESGHRVAVVSRGYGGSLEGRVAPVSDGEKVLLTPREAGDEAVLLARRLKGAVVVLGAERLKAVEYAAREYGATVAILDDGFQHLKLQRCLDILVLDAVRPFGNGYCLPRGTLREPLEAAADADLIIISRVNRIDSQRLSDLNRKLAELNPAAPVFTSTHEPEGVRAWPGGEPEPLKSLTQKKVLAFAGIGKPESFFSTLAELGASVTHTVEFMDHHPYSREDVDRLLSWAKLTHAEALITTEKDAMRLENFLPLELPLLVLSIRLGLLSGEADFKKMLLDRAGRAPK